MRFILDGRPKGKTTSVGRHGRRGPGQLNAIDAVTLRLVAAGLRPRPMARQYRDDFPGHPNAKPNAEHQHELASMIHLCGAGAAKAFTQRGFRLVVAAANTTSKHTAPALKRWSASSCVSPQSDISPRLGESSTRCQRCTTKPNPPWKDKAAFRGPALFIDPHRCGPLLRQCHSTSPALPQLLSVSTALFDRVGRMRPSALLSEDPRRRSVRGEFSQHPSRSAPWGPQTLHSIGSASISNPPPDPHRYHTNCLSLTAQA